PLPAENRGPSEATSFASHLALISESIDYRLVLIGSMLPDIIDKPIGHYLIPSFSNGRIFCHTLLFFLLIFFIGLCRYRRQAKTGLLVLSFGSLLHLFFDQMWCAPQTLFWPILGLDFPKEDLNNVIGDMWEAILSEPSIYVPEIIGLVILIPFGMRLLRGKQLLLFLKSGAVL
ncbi:MAG: metal-dependent hydrolase, partial [Chloroflexota bacterium]|nr:metal-dependent hydrolase [Chloroflexota bacterium]